jgi:hypothetical protein
MPAAKMIRFHKEQDGWLQKQFFLQRSFAAALRARSKLGLSVQICGACCASCSLQGGRKA